MYRSGFFSHHEPADGRVAVANSSGVATLFYGPVPEGYCWYVERISVNAPTSGATCEVFASTSGSSTSESTRMDFTPTGNNDIMDEVNPIYLPSGYFLALRWASATSGDACTSSIQKTVHQLNPAALMSFPDQVLVEERHEHKGAPLNIDAVGERAV